MQLEETDCGAASLGIVLRHYGCWISLEELRDKCSVGRDGSNLADIAIAAREYGMVATGQSSEISQLSKLPLPMIIFWGFNHFVVLEGTKNSKYYLNDPAEGHRIVDEDDFFDQFTGVGLALEKGPSFQAVGGRQGSLEKIWPWLSDHKPLLLRSAALGLLLSLFALILPLVLRLFIDSMLQADMSDHGYLFVLSMLALGGSTYLLTWFQMRSLRDLVVRVSTTQSVRFLDTLLQLPTKFFAHRFTGDLALRMRMIDQVTDTGARQLVLIAIDITMSSVFLVAMLVWNLNLALFILGLGLTCVLLTRLLSHLRRDKNHRLRREQGVLAGASASVLNHIEALQATARETNFFSEWSGRQARELSARQHFVELGHVATSLPQSFQLLTAAVTFGLGGWFFVAGELTTGDLMGFYMLAINFIGPVSRSAQFSDVLETLDADMARLEDVSHAPPEVIVHGRSEADQPDKVKSVEGRLRLVGKFEIRNVTFGFQTNRTPLIEDFSLTIEPGQRVALVGPSSSGKSTIAQLAAGLFQPWAGEVLYDGYSQDQIPREVFCRSISMVDQNPVLFAASVQDNLTMWDVTIPHQWITSAARDAWIHQDILTRPGGYAAIVEEGGRNFSGGQRLRLEIARALVHRPSLLILDEATSALDPHTEMLVDDKIRQRGCSCLIVAHRLSTIRDADCIVVMDQGQVLEQGTHNELYRQDSFYKELIEGE